MPQNECPKVITMLNQLPKKSDKVFGYVWLGNSRRFEYITEMDGAHIFRKRK